MARGVANTRIPMGPLSEMGPLDPAAQRGRTSRPPSSDWHSARCT